MKVNKVVETSLYVDDVDRSRRFYAELFGFERLVEDDRFCALSVNAQQVLLLFRKRATLEPIEIPGGVIPPHDGDGEMHLAFAIDAADLDGWRARLIAGGIGIESTVQWPRGGTSLYFRDPDRHLVELITPGCWAIY